MKTLVDIANVIKYIVALIVLSMITIGVNAQNTPAKTGYAPVNGLKMYYEIHGTGRPLVLLHGGLMTIGSTYGRLIPALSKDRQVIAIELQGHGHTADIDRPYSFDGFADDVAATIKYLELDSADVLGYSSGGEVALYLAIRHPEVVRRLVIISSAARYDGYSASMRSIFPAMNAEMFAQTSIRTEYEKVAPDPKNFTQLVSKMRDFIVTPFNFGADNIRAIKSPTLLIYGDSDGVEPDHIVELFRLRGGWVDGDMGGSSESQLAIFPGASHTGLMDRPDLLVNTILPFLQK